MQWVYVQRLANQVSPFQGLEREGRWRRVGLFADFELLVSPMLGSEVQLLVHGAAKHPVRIQTTAHGTTRALEHVVNNLEEYFSQAEETIGQARKRLVDLKGQVDLPLEYVTRLCELASRQQQLVSALHLTRNAANTAETAEASEATKG